MTAVTTDTDKDKVRFMKYVQKEENGCWRFTGARGISGYCNFFYNGTCMLAHRASLLVFGKVKKLTPGLQVAHSCPNRNCVNPDHLSEKTSSQNNGIDKREHKKDLSGERCHFSKLTWASVEEIRTTPNMNRKSLAEHYGVCVATISAILSGKTWKKE